MQEASPQKKIPLSKRRSVQRMVTKQQRVILEQEGEMSKLDPTFGSLNGLCDALFLENLLKRLFAAMCVGTMFADDTFL